ncbi:chemotaxis protein CheA [Geotalea uraniireducens]|uniref:histidine kinase n=1 Tax=Geotalea uraniireducens (strain Rf4) TaxID=351605 RepID=A5G500_GEOUR|nr:chemotaxis protein CheA [Geotalea uraniireducens]ABQ26868.1 CheA signal transduction histidine kinase [Geotalea uraniireducens Rf4]
MDTTIDMSVLLDEFLEDAAEHLEAAESSLLLLEKRVNDGLHDEGGVTLLLGNLHTLKGNAGMMGLTPLQQYVHKMESVLKQVVDGSLSLTSNLFESFYSAINSLRESLEKLAKNSAEPLDFSDELTLLEYLVSGGAERNGGISYGREKKDDFGYITQKSNTLKVNFEKLDDLLNLVGELVIQRTTLLAFEAKLKETVKDRAVIEAFSESSQLIGKSAADLREAIMKVRMLPVKVVFQRFNRLVRDLSHKHGKEINLVFEGEETELDKTVVDEIGEPLLHLIRNAVDHGIESPDERRMVGKPPVATVALRARHENNHMIVSVEDDGRGISIEKLKNSAVAKGLIDHQQARALTDQEALQLVFIPGFSTSREVTETSGRGIGLDVVKNAVTAFNGMIDIDSMHGAGTTFTIKLPLTLAIIASLMVEVSGEVFAVPLSGVLESIKIDKAEIHQVASGEIINLRDRILPIVRLNEFFGLNNTPTTEEMEYVVIVGSGEKRGGIIVDRLIGQQEIVIKAMDDYLGPLPGISGGTVLGDGSVALILDIGSLMGKTGRGGTDGGL